MDGAERFVVCGAIISIVKEGSFRMNVFCVSFNDARQNEGLFRKKLNFHFTYCFPS